MTSIFMLHMKLISTIRMINRDNSTWRKQDNHGLVFGFTCCRKFLYFSNEKRIGSLICQIPIFSDNQ